MRAGGSYVSSTHTEIMSTPTLNFLSMPLQSLLMSTYEYYCDCGFFNGTDKKIWASGAALGL